ncbi:hypothetical protein UFOVP53_72 [uncultured Caudovirales phage]|uniref:Uncharacterized protein n=1 Tax=uncultured Caudovirales phage TaxID=2100421 RepID=A0A6J5KVF7_9CAUD|nr:hypothetical protein UFOVP53_72 [uncultured Caudovirales phage]
MLYILNDGSEKDIQIGDKIMLSNMHVSDFISAKILEVISTDESNVYCIIENDLASAISPSIITSVFKV